MLLKLVSIHAPLYENVSHPVSKSFRVGGLVWFGMADTESRSVLLFSMKSQQLQAAQSREIPFHIPTTTTPYTKSKSPTPRDELESLIMPPIRKAASGCLLAAAAALI